MQNLKKLWAKILIASLVLAILPTNLVSATGDLSVELTSNPAPAPDLTGEYRVDAEVGDVVEFTRHVTAAPGVQFGWEWFYDPAYLDCTAVPFFDSDTLRCTVLQEHYSPVFIELYPNVGNAVQSNAIWVSVNSVNWDVLALSHAPFAHLDPQTGNVVLEITATMQYRSEGASIIFPEDYLWGVNCRIFHRPNPPETSELFQDTQFFGAGTVQETEVFSGDRVSSTVAIQLDRSLMEGVKSGSKTLFCGLTAKRQSGDQYFETLLLGINPQIRHEAIFHLSRADRWKTGSWQPYN